MKKTLSKTKWLFTHGRKSLILQSVSFLTGFALMVFELAAARVLAPTIGSSTYIWTSVIGMIIAALSVGYWLGGKLADMRNKTIDAAVLCLVTAVLVAVATFLYPFVLTDIVQLVADSRWQGVIASLILFAPTSFVLGMISSYLAKLAIVSLETSGQSVAGLSAFNSLGGIFGTFLTGFVLFSFIGAREVMLVVVVVLLASSWMLVPKQRIAQRIFMSIAALALVMIPAPVARGVMYQTESTSSSYQVVEATRNGEPVRLIKTGPRVAQSGVYVDKPDELVFWYNRHVVDALVEYKPSNVLVLGGGTFTMPGNLAKQLPDTTIDVVEIDPKLYELAKQYFHYEDRDNVNLIFQDARTYVNQATESYDAIFIDVYGDSSVPFPFLTEEYGEHIARLTKPNGLVLVNSIVGTYPGCRDMYAAVDAVYRPHFAYTAWQTETGTVAERANHVLAYTRSSAVIPQGMHPLESFGRAAYTDNFTPAERINADCRV